MGGVAGEDSGVEMCAGERCSSPSFGAGNTAYRMEKPPVLDHIEQVANDYFLLAVELDIPVFAGAVVVGNTGEGGRNLFREVHSSIDVQSEGVLGMGILESGLSECVNGNKGSFEKMSSMDDSIT